MKPILLCITCFLIVFHSLTFCFADIIEYHYDYSNRLTAVDYLSTGVRIDYTYDDLGNRKSKLIKVNQPPTINGEPLTIVDEDLQYYFKPTAQDEENDGLSFEIENQPAWLNFDENSGELKGTPDNSNVGIFENIIISVSDDKGNRSSLPAFDITVKNINDSPILREELVLNLSPISEDPDLNTGIAIDDFVLDNMITDIDKDSLKGIAVTGVDNSNGQWQYSVNSGFSWLNCSDITEQIVDMHSNAVLLDENAKIRFVPKDNYHGNSSLTFCAWDQTSGETGQKVDTTQKGETSPFSMNEENVSISIIAVNDAPIAKDLIFVIDEDTALTANMQANDVDNDPVSFQIIDQGTKGIITLIDAASGTFAYTPFLDVIGQDVITYKVNDGIVDSNVASLTMTILSIYDPPITKDLNFTTNENTAIHQTLFCEDNDSNVQLFEIIDYPSRGTVLITDSTSGSFTYTPDSFETGIDSFSYKVDDQLTGSNISNVTITILPVTKRIVGNVNYTGLLSGELYIGAYEVDDEDYENPIVDQVHTWESGINSIDYTLSVDDGKRYNLFAFLDKDFSSEFEMDEPSGFNNASEVSIMIIQDETQRDITMCLKGDANYDDKLSFNDAVAAFKLHFSDTWTDDQLCRADFNNDGIISPKDARLIFLSNYDFE
ncbi:conserved hypothetical protein, secreted [Candidatus Magnetomorum sp. HK-1]|nr:conserved hypothetical protein, secreted [Candidatus Magnetomorum sp. HK-1]